jgi:hypothetical protein
MGGVFINLISGQIGDIAEAWGGNCSLHGSIISITYTPEAKQRPKRGSKKLAQGSIPGGTTKKQETP